jgi:alpha,alpha-trehalase
VEHFNLTKAYQRMALLMYFAIFLVTVVHPQQHEQGWEIEPAVILKTLLEEEDIDGDHKITIHDPFVPGTPRGDKLFWFNDRAGAHHLINGADRLAYLLEELTILKDRDTSRGFLRCDRIFEDPVDHIARSIRERCWDGLTRRIDEEGLHDMLRDEKLQAASGGYSMYVPAGDTMAIAYFAGIAARHPGWDLRVDTIHGVHDFVTDPPELRRHGLLSLALRISACGDTSGVPFVVPGGRFNEMYGWDSYFIILGLLHDGRDSLARDMVQNHVYEIERYGAILNANRTYYLTRSQPPFLTSSALACYARMPSGRSRDAWLRRVIGAAVQEYRDVWMNRDHLLSIGLSRYHDAGHGVPPEVEPGHFNTIFRKVAQRIGMDPTELERQYSNGQFHNEELDAYFAHDRAMRESGHDTSNRLVARCDSLATVDLNALLYKIEVDIAMVIKTVFHGTLRLENGRIERSADWTARALHRQALMNTYLWDPKAGIYTDYDIHSQARTGYESATVFWPLWAGVASREQAHSVVIHGLRLLEEAGGLAASSQRSRGEISRDSPQRQWDYPFGWAPHQMLAWDGLRRYGYLADARRLAYKWLLLIRSNAADFNGTIPEKFDVVRCTHQVFAEYGNVGTAFDYITREGFGWTNASFQVGLKLLGRSHRTALNLRVPAECVNFQADN